MINISILNLTQIPKELKLILKIINHEKGERLFIDDIDWSLFRELAFHHRIYPTLYTKIKMLEHNAIPAQVINILEQAYQSNTFKMMYLYGEMGHVNDLCTNNNIPILFLKGPILAMDLYGDISLRTSCDLDFMIPIGKLEQIDEILHKEGYQKDDYINSILGDWKWRHHHITYLHPQKNIKLEVHWRLNPGPGREPAFDELWGRKREVGLTSKPFYYLGKEDLFYFLVLHGARHGWSRLRWLLDIDRLIHQNIDWIEIEKLFKKFGVLHLAGQSLTLCANLLNTKISKEIIPLVHKKKSAMLAEQAIFYSERMVNLHSDSIPEFVSKHHRSHLISLMSHEQRFLYFLSILFPYYTDVETLPLPKAFHILYFPLRPFLWAWRKTRNHALP